MDLKRWVRDENATRALSVFATRRPFSRARLDRFELPVDWRDLLVRSRATGWRAELVSAALMSAAAIRYGSSPEAGRRVIDVYAWIRTVGLVVMESFLSARWRPSCLPRRGRRERLMNPWTDRLRWRRPQILPTFRESQIPEALFLRFDVEFYRLCGLDGLMGCTSGLSSAPAQSGRW
jgi:hypothetical protein